MSPEELIRHFQEALVKTVATGEPTAEMQKAFSDDLVSEGGAAERSPFSSSTGFHRFQRLSFSFLGAKFALIGAQGVRLSIGRLRSIPLSERLKIAQSQSWHHRYVLRERLLKLFDLFRTTIEGKVLQAQIVAIAAKYKKRSDRLLQSRHRTIHEYEHHNPLISQLENIELLSGTHVADIDFRRAMTSHLADVGRRNKRAVFAQLLSGDQAFLALTETHFGEVLALSPTWSFEGEKGN